MRFDFAAVRDLLQKFDFASVFREHLGWSRPPQGAAKWASFRTADGDFDRRMIAELSGVAVFEVRAPGAAVPKAKERERIHKAIGAHHHEHLLIFVDDPRRTQSLWSWVKRGDKRDEARAHYFFKGQPGDLFLGKLDAMVFDLADFDADGHVPIVEVARKLRAALDVERVTEKFYKEFQEQHRRLLGMVEGIADERDRRWYVSVLLNRLMFIYFMQWKRFVGGDTRYLQNLLKKSRAAGPGRYYRDYLRPLFFEGFAKPEDQRSPEARARLGHICYLNGGLFLPHAIEEKNAIDVPDQAFDDVYDLFERYDWHLDDTPGGDDRYINPHVLGYIFEKYINDQKSSGAYYTRPELTSYLCEQTIHRLVLDAVNEEDIPGLPGSGPGGQLRRFEDIADLLLNLDPKLCWKLLERVLPGLKLLDPACGSGAFLVAAAEELRELYGAVVGQAEVLPDTALREHIAGWRAKHPSLGYFFKKRIITHNVFGVDLMEEATEIARLRLFLSLVASAEREDQLEPLPNVDFNIMAGNSLIGLLHVKEERFERKTRKGKAQKGQLGFGGTIYRQTVEEKNRLVAQYRDASSYTTDLVALRDNINEKKAKAQERLDELLLDDFADEYGIKFEQPTWDDKKNDVGKANKRPLHLRDVRALRPFHWDYEFDEVFRAKGGFDAILANPPWEIFKPNSKEFFQEYSELVSKNNMRIEEFEREQKKLLKTPSVHEAWLEYLARFPYVSEFYRRASQYKHQISVVSGKKAGTDINLYKLFVEQCLNLLRPGGQLGMVVPGSLYSDLGAKQLRATLFGDNTLRAIYGFSNERFLFEKVDHRFKICLLVATRGGSTQRFDAAFRINPREAIDAAHLPQFLRDRRQHIELTPALVHKTSPDSLSIMEFRDAADVSIVEKMLTYPLLGDQADCAWSVELMREFDMTNDSELFELKPGKGRLPLYEGKMIHQFNHLFAEPRYWIDQARAVAELDGSRRRRLRATIKEAGAILDAEELPVTFDHEHFRFGFRDIARNTDERSMICAVLPPNVFAGNTLNLLRPIRDRISEEGWEEVPTLTAQEMLFVVAVLNSFTADWLLRQRISAHLNMFYVYQLPIPRLTKKDSGFDPIVERAAKLTCTTPEFDALAKEVGLKSHAAGETRPEWRSALRAEIDGLVAHLYGLTEEEFVHVLDSFPVVPEPQRVAAHNAYRDVARGRLP